MCCPRRTSGYKFPNELPSFEDQSVSKRECVAEMQASVISRLAWVVSVQDVVLKSPTCSPGQSTAFKHRRVSSSMNSQIECYQEFSARLLPRFPPQLRGVFRWSTADKCLSGLPNQSHLVQKTSQRVKSPEVIQFPKLTSTKSIANAKLNEFKCQEYKSRKFPLKSIPIIKCKQVWLAISSNA